MTGITQNHRAAATTGRGTARRAAKLAAAWTVLPGALLCLAALAPAAHAATATAGATARIQSLLDNPVNGTVNLPAGTFTIRPHLVLHQGEKITGHHTTLKVAPRSGSYHALLAGATPSTDLSGLSITGVTFNQNASANPIGSITAIYKAPRFVIMAVTGTRITITGDHFTGIDDVNTIATGGATHNVTISHNTFQAANPAMHDHSTIYTSGTTTVITGNTFTGTAMLDSAAIEVHADKATITGNHISGYYRAANIVASDTTFKGNHVAGAANPVDLWSFAPAALRNVTITGNTLGRDLPYWRTVMARHHLAMPLPQTTRPIIRNPVSTLPFHNISAHGNVS